MHFVVTQQFVRVLLHDLTEMRRDHRAGVHHGIAECMGLFALILANPHRVEIEHRIANHRAAQLAIDLARVDREFAPGLHLRLADCRTVQRDAVSRGLQIKVVANVHRRHQETEFL